MVRQRNLEALHSVTILAPTTVSAANDTAAIDCSAFDGDVCLILTAPASAAASAMKVKVQAGSASDGSDAEDVSGGAFPDLADAAYHRRLVLSKDELPSRLRLRFFDETGSYSAAVSCVAVGVKKYRP